jgi:nicotinamidase-related amidase
VIEVDLASRTPAALVTDVQEVFTWPEGPFENTGFGPLAAALNDFLRGCRAAGVPVVFSSYVFRAGGIDAGLQRGQPWVEPMSEGSPWIGVDRRIERAEGDLELRHNRPSAFFRSDLESVLHGLGADAVLLCGLSVNNAISATARDAFARDVPVLVVRDCTGAAPWEPHHDLYFEILSTWTAEVAPADEVLARLRR